MSSKVTTEKNGSIVKKSSYGLPRPTVFDFEVGQPFLKGTKPAVPDPIQEALRYRRVFRAICCVLLSFFVILLSLLLTWYLLRPKGVCSSAKAAALCNRMRNDSSSTIALPTTTIVASTAASTSPLPSSTPSATLSFASIFLSSEYNNMSSDRTTVEQPSTSNISTNNVSSEHFDDSQSEEKATDDHIYRLPRSLKPLRYNLRIRPYVDVQLDDVDRLFTFDGRIQIKFTVLDEGVQNITLNARRLKVTTKNGVPEVSIRNLRRNSPKLSITNVASDEPKQLLVLHLSGRLTVGAVYILNMNYVGLINNALDNPFGFYYSTYLEKQNVEDSNSKSLVPKIAAVTQFQFENARSAFPCFDEPWMKAVFQVSICRRENWKALSNTNRASQTSCGDDSWVLDKFTETPVMSTYLVAWSIHQYHKVTAHTKRNKTPVTVWFPQIALREDIFTASLPLSSALYRDVAKQTAEALDAIADYFDHPYVLDKMDLVIVNEFPQGAMENWGLLVFLDKFASSNLMIYHEIVHQWFGNVVTAEWWDDYWLHEAVATFLSFDLQNESQSFMISDSFRIQSMVPVPAIGAPVRLHSDLAFDSSYLFESKYEKASPVLSMLADVIGRDTLRDALRMLVKKHLHSTISRYNFYKACNEALELRPHIKNSLPFSDVRQFLEPFIEKPGFPIVKYSAEDATVTAVQWFSGPASLLSAENNSENGAPPMIPVPTTNTVTGSVQRVWLTSNVSVPLQELENAEELSVLPNFGLSSYFLLDMSDEFPDVFTNRLNLKHEFSTFHAFHSHILANAFTLANIGQLSYARLLDWVKMLVRVNENLRDIIVQQVLQIDYLLKYTGDTYLAWQKQYAMPLFEFFVQNSADATSSAEMQMLDYACFNGFKMCAKKGYTAFMEWLQASSSWRGFANYTEPFIRNLFCSAVRHGDPGFGHVLLDRLISQSDSTAFAEQQLAIVGPAVFCSQDEELLEKSMDQFFQSEHNWWAKEAAWKFAARNPAAMPLLWRHILDSIANQTLQKEQETILMLTEHIFPEIGIFHEFWSWVQPDQINAAIKKWRHNHLSSDKLSKLAKILDFVRFRERWRAQHLATISNWLSSNSATKTNSRTSEMARRA